ncbi:MAG: hypothetical protein F7C81_00140 [Desulfurococcales archaeon]|nr:hypothetical protein [Desulfurococcales archaeon]
MEHDLLLKIVKGIIELEIELVKKLNKKRLKGERAEIWKDIQGLIGKVTGHDVRTYKKITQVNNIKVYRYLIKAGKYIISIHDPIIFSRGMPEESVTGVDYALQVPIMEDVDKFIFIQSKTEYYVLTYKQLFSMGLVYSVFLGLIDIVRSYLAYGHPIECIFPNAIEYLRKKGKPYHKEFLFISLIQSDRSRLYIPLSTILRSYTLRRKNSSMEVRDDKCTIRSVASASLNLGLCEVYESIDKLYEAIIKCDIGYSLPRETYTVAAKEALMALVSGVNQRLVIHIFPHEGLDLGVIRDLPWDMTLRNLTCYIADFS